MEFNKQLIWLWTHCRAIGMVHLSNMVGERKGIGSKGMELDIALFTIELVAENVALKKTVERWVTSTNSAMLFGRRLPHF